MRQSTEVMCGMLSTRGLDLEAKPFPMLLVRQNAEHEPILTLISQLASMDMHALLPCACSFC